MQYIHFKVMELERGEVFSPPSTSTLPLVIPTHHTSSHRLTIRSSRCYRQSHPRKNFASPNPPRSITTPGAPSKHDRVHHFPKAPLELGNKVWKYASFEPRIFKSFENQYWWNDSGTRESRGCTRETFTNTISIPKS